MLKKLHSNKLRKQIFLCLFFFIVGVWFLFQTNLDNHHAFFLPKNLALKSADDYKDYADDLSNSGCHIPQLDIYDPSIKEALEEDDPPIICDKKSTGVLVRSNLTHLYLNHQLLKKFNLVDHLTCCFRPFWRITSNSNTYDPDIDSQYKYLDECIPFRSAVYMEAVDQVRVECSLEDQVIYKDFYAFIPNSYRHKGEDYTPQKNLSIIVLGIDGLSRLNFRRQMPDTHSFLVNKIGASEFLGYHKVDDNTFPNLIPVLAGKSENEITNSCWPDTKNTFDNCSFLWNSFKEAGFITGFGEDASWMGLFKYGKVGFQKQPTDIYLRTFNYVSENELGHEQRSNANLCIGPKLNIEVLLDAVNKFVIRLMGKLSFGFFWENSLSHDYLNLPKYGDSMHVTLFDGFLQEGVFNKSVVIVMSDHGIRWGKIRLTYQGYIEERLPLLIVSCPTWFQKRFPLAMANLKKNTLRLTTPYDLHETLKDLKNLSSLENDNIIKRSLIIRKEGGGKMPRGMSLFLPIQKTRSCVDADIADHWCTCHQDKDISTNDTIVVKAASFVIDSVNSILTGHTQCAKLFLKTILDARLKVLPIKTDLSEDESNQRVKDYVVRLEATPGNATFEATVQHSPATDKFHLVGSISRANTYGNSSYCVNHYKLKLYCFCI